MPAEVAPEIHQTEIQTAIKEGNSDRIRELIGEKEILNQKFKIDYVFDPEYELDSYKFLGAYLGRVTPLQYAILCGQDLIAKDIIDSSFEDDLNSTMGGNNTALHLATFLGAREIVKLLIDRGANPSIKNSKGFTPLDVVDDPEMNKLYNQLSQSDLCE